MSCVSRAEIGGRCLAVRRERLGGIALAGLLSAVAGLLLGSALACGDAGPARATLSVAETLTGADTVGFARATEPRDFVFPEDHGPHPDFKHEWWYFTGNLEAAPTLEGTGNAPIAAGIGFQLTFFRSAIHPDTARLVRSQWATRQAYMAHFAVSDIDRGAFHAFERFDRGALGLAGAVGGAGEPLRVWVGDWEASSSGKGFTIRAEEDGVGVDLRLLPTQPVVLQGEGGLSRKGPEPGNASYYYSMMRLDARGTVTVGGAALPVRGEAWLDREWSTSALSPGLVGWDWFSLQLDDESELMLYRLRTGDGATAPFSAGTFVDADGTVVRLSHDDFSLHETGSWTSPRGGRYPSGWRIRVPLVDLDLVVQPRLADQELDLAFRYWEGAIAGSGRSAGREVAGKGYVELTGYADEAGSPATAVSSSTPSTSSSRRPNTRRIP